jgi:tetratricopeptide (TPR) repeat protein
MGDRSHRSERCERQGKKVSHPFGDLVSQYLHRKHGLSQARLAAGIGQAPAVITRMCQGERLTGPQARDRVLAIIGWLHKQGALATVEEADALLNAAGMAPLRETVPVEEALCRDLYRLSRDAPPDTHRQGLPLVAVNYPLVGRHAEWQVLRSAWQTAVQGEAHFVSIAGDAGIGKTRLAEELLAYARRNGHAASRTRAYALEARLAYAPVSDWLRSPALVRDVRRLDRVWRGELARLLPELLIEDASLPAPTPLTERWQRKQLYEALVQAVGAKRNQTLLLVLDDAQWCDHETLEWLRYLLAAAARLKLLVVGTVRDAELEADHPLHKLWRDLALDGQLTSIALAPLTEDETLRLGASVMHHELDARSAARLIQECAGNPLFAIESLRTRHEEMDGTGGARASSQHTSVALPPRIYAVIRTRLAQLSPGARSLAEIAAVIGRAFTPALLVHAAQRDEGAVAESVDELSRRRLWDEQDGSHYDFSHDRIRDVAYAEIGAAKRRHMHLAVAQSIHALSAEDVDDVAAELAYHYEAAGRGDEAMPYLMRAIQRSVDVSALQNALALSAQGLRIMHTLPETEANIRLKIELYLRQADYVSACKGWTDPQMAHAFTQVQQLSLRIDDRQLIYLGQTKLRLYHTLRSELPQARAIADKNVELAESIDNPLLLQDAYHALGRVHLYEGNLLDARIRLEQSLMVGKSVQPQHEVMTEGQPTGYGYANLAHCVCLLGDLQLARRCSQQAFAIARTGSDHFVLATILHFDVILNQMLRDKAVIERQNRAMRHLAEQYGFPFYAEMSRLNEGYVSARHGHAQEGIALLRRGLAYFERQEFGMFRSLHLGLLVEACLIAESYGAGLEECEHALARADRTGEQFWTPELHRLKGDLVLGRAGAKAQAEESYRRAIRIARQQSSKLLELRSTVSLARLWLQRGRRAEAHQMLSRIYGCFAEGLDTPDLMDARALLHTAWQPSEPRP